MRIVVLADSDSYVKWGAALAGTLPPEWERELLVVDSPIVVSDAQLAAAVAGSGVEAVARVAFAGLAARLSAEPPEVVLVATVGPMARVLLRMLAALRPRPVLVSGLPGISVPATRKALLFRRQADLMVLHSRREIREFGALDAVVGGDHRFGLARLPFVSDRPAGGDDLVFAAQAVVPLDRADRARVAVMLRDAALHDPSRRVVVKLRAVGGERQTHAEQHGYPDLIAELGPVPGNLRFVAGPMADALDTAAGLVTVSSTAVLEAVARGIPAIALDVFGVTPELINPVFVGSGLFGSVDDVVHRRFRHPDPGWLADNYFHAEDDWLPTVLTLVEARRRGTLPDRAPQRRWGGWLRDAWDRRRVLGAADRSAAGVVALLVGVPARGLVRAARRISAGRSLRASPG